MKRQQQRTTLLCSVCCVCFYMFICFQDGRVGEHIHVRILWCSVLHDTKLGLLASHKCVGGIYSHLCVIWSDAILAQANSADQSLEFVLVILYLRLWLDGRRIKYTVTSLEHFLDRVGLLLDKQSALQTLGVNTVDDLRFFFFASLEEAALAGLGHQWQAVANCGSGTCSKAYHLSKFPRYITGLDSHRWDFEA